MEKGKIFTSEAVSEGHPDKVCDQISDAILTECLKQDKNSHVACEVLISSNNLVIAGEISTSAKVNYEEVARKVLKDIGYSNASDGFDFENAKIDVIIKEQSSDINNAVSNGVDQGAGDQGIIFGYACNETKNYMPLTIEIAQEILKLAAIKRKSGEFKWAKPDMKSQVSIEYGDDNTQNKVDTEEKEVGQVNTPLVEEKADTSENNKNKKVSKLKVVKEVTKVVSRDIEGEYGIYHIEGNVVNINDEYAFTNTSEVKSWASETRKELAEKLEKIKTEIRHINMCEAEALEVIETYM